MLFCRQKFNARIIREKTRYTQRKYCSAPCGLYFVAVACFVLESGVC